MNVEVFCFDAVAPVRERGLKSIYCSILAIVKVSRSREGAWIEMVAVESNKVGDWSLP